MCTFRRLLKAVEVNKLFRRNRVSLEGKVRDDLYFGWVKTEGYN